MRPPKVTGGRTEQFQIKLSKDEKLLIKTVADKLNASQADMLMSAVKVGLVDVLGDFNTAVEIAANSAGLEENDYKLKYYGPKKPDLFGLPFGAAASIKEEMVREELGDMYQVYKNVQRLKHMQGIQALMPVEVIIR